jgi:hypothetical protein
LKTLQYLGRIIVFDPHRVSVRIHCKPKQAINDLIKSFQNITLMMKILVAILFAVVVSPLVSTVTAFIAPQRREFLQRAVTIATTTGTILSFPLPSEANVVTSCQPKSKNCLTTRWSSGAGKTISGADVAAILNTYPQEGQNGVDLGGWKFVENNLANGGSAKVEYKSGIGTFAKFFNGGQPFVDDLIVEVADGVVTIKSASRIGDSDLGVNQKRLQYLAAQARAKGWDAPDPTY